MIVDAEPGQLAVAETVDLQGGRRLVRVTDTWDAIESRRDDLADAFLDLTVKTTGTDTTLAERARETFPFLVKVRAYRAGSANESVSRRPPGPGRSCTARTTGRSIPEKSRPTPCSRSSATCWRRWAMRPHELTVEGFRSYRNKTTFDWRGRRLVGIVGPIGSGKSSIIDAISFALFGKTPSVERDTKSLIHQLCDQCHVELVFEVDGQVWRVQRALRSNGQAGSKLQLVTQDGGEPDVPEIITGVRTINERIEQLLGMDFDAFRRSVLLAQNRFSEFLKATAGDRDKVLKGVFGYEVLDHAQRVAKSRLDRAETDLEALGDERRRIDEARARLEESRTNAASAERRLRDLEAAAPEVERLTKERNAAAADDAASAEQIAALIQVTASLPNPADVDAAVDAASAADDVVAAAEAAFGRRSRRSPSGRSSSGTSRPAWATASGSGRSTGWSSSRSRSRRCSMRLGPTSDRPRG